MGKDLWTFVDTSYGLRKPEKYFDKVSVEDIIVLADAQPNEFIDLIILYSEQEDSAEFRSSGAILNESETAAENTKFWKSETATEKKNFEKRNCHRKNKIKDKRNCQRKN